METIGCKTPEPSQAAEPILPGSDSGAHWRALRACWLDLQDARLKSFEDTDFSRDLRRRHTEALKAVVASKELQADVAEEIRVAFEQAIAHIQRQMATCYIALPPEYTPRQNLTTQAAALTEMAGRSNINRRTVARARAALERDMAWLSQFQAGKRPGKLESVAVTPAEAEAARILVELLLGKK